MLATPSWPVLFPPRVVSLAEGEAKLLDNTEKCWTTVCYLTRCIKYSWHLEYDIGSMDISLDISLTRVQGDPQKNKNLIKLNMIKTLASNNRIRFKSLFIEDGHKCRCLCLRVCVSTCLFGWTGVCMFVCFS